LIIDSRLEGDTAKYKLFFSEYIGEYEQNNVFIRYIYSAENYFRLCKPKSRGRS